MSGGAWGPRLRFSGRGFGGSDSSFASFPPLSMLVTQHTVQYPSETAENIGDVLLDLTNLANERKKTALAAAPPFLRLPAPPLLAA